MWSCPALPGPAAPWQHNVVLLPHLGNVSEAGFRSMYGQVVEDIAAFLAGSAVRTISGNDPGFTPPGE